MRMLTERIEVLLTSAQLRRLERIAEERQISIGALIREAVDAYTVPGSRSKREATETLFSLSAPVAEWETMREEILRGAVG